MPQNQNQNQNQHRNQGHQQGQDQNQSQSTNDPRREERDNRQQNLSTSPPNATRAASVPRDNKLTKPSEEWNRAENTGQIQRDEAQDDAMEGDNVRNAREEGSRSQRNAG